MTTFISDLASSLDNRWTEVETLIDKANDERENENLYNAICRSTLVLIVAHFEGFIRDTIKSILNDINSFSNFYNSPYALKKTFCSVFLDINEKGNERRINNLIKAFDKLDTKYELEPFLFENNKNPSPNIIDKVFSRFGIDDFFAIIQNSVIDEIFENDKTENQIIINDLKQTIINGTEKFPYEIDFSLYKFDIGTTKKSTKNTLWKEFLDELLRKRHLVAHGSDLSNQVSTYELTDFEIKIKVLQYTIMIILCNSSIKR